MIKPELLAPAGSMNSLYAAIEAGCDAVYLSGYMFGARQFATNFSEEEIISSTKICHLYGVKVYVTVNTLIYEDEVETFLNYIDFLHKNNVDAVLIQDIGMLDLIRQSYPNLEVHASTQMHIHNKSGVKFCKKMGIKRVVLARETSLDNIKDIRKNTDLELEVFVHGALCMSYSGQCLMSSLIGGRSGNRGACAGSCRLPYSIVDNKNNKLNINDYPISTKDLCTIESIGELIESGVNSLKIEGRMKRPEYVYLIVSLYRKAIDSYLSNGKVDITDNDIKDIKKIFNRGFTKGFLFNENNNSFVQTYRPNHLGIEIGKVVGYSKGFVLVHLTDTLFVKDGIRIIEDDLGCTVIDMYINHEKVLSAKKGDIVSFPLNGSIKVGDTLVKTTDYKQLEDINQNINLKTRKVSITGKIDVQIGKPLFLTISDGINEIKVEGDIVDTAINYPLTKEDVINQIDRLGDTIYKFSSLTVNIDNNCYVNKKVLNEIRRNATNELNKARCYSTNYLKNNYKRDCPSFDQEKVKTCLIDSDNIYNKIKDDNYKYIYVEDLELFNKIESDEKVILKLPRVIENSKITDKKVMISELGSLCNSNIITSDFSLNVVNSYSVALLHSLGVNLITLSYELNERQIKKIIDEYYKRYSKYPNLEVIVYSKVEAMVCKFNINEYYKTNDKLYLVDRFNNRYPIINKKGFTYILDYKINDLKDYNKYYEMGINSVRFELINK